MKEHKGDALPENIVIEFDSPTFRGEYRGRGSVRGNYRGLGLRRGYDHDRGFGRGYIRGRGYRGAYSGLYNDRPYETETDNYVTTTTTNSEASNDDPDLSDNDVIDDTDNH